jgi:hypothetical protein
VEIRSDDNGGTGSCSVRLSSDMSTLKAWDTLRLIVVMVDKEDPDLQLHQDSLKLEL